ncbi:MAG: hypothetical protein P8X58_11460 [Syntrophobacterales bacterium]
MCKNCFRCVQGCPRELVVKTLSPQYESLGDEYWTPEILLSTWYQAETGKIPVSGAGYGGPFAGDGFDGIWTDMSEIVRPTRDGIHGREYISTAIDLGRHPLWWFPGSKSPRNWLSPRRSWSPATPPGLWTWTIPSCKRYVSSKFWTPTTW